MAEKLPEKPKRFSLTIMAGLCFCFLIGIFSIAAIAVVGWSIMGWDVKGIETWITILISSISFSMGILMGANMR